MAVATETEHVCNPERRLDYELFQLRDEVSDLGSQVVNYLASARGQFEAWTAERERRHQNPNEPADEDS